MINKMDTVLSDLEKKEKRLKEQVSAVEKSKSDVDAPSCVAAEELVRIDELMSAIKKIQQVPDDSRLDQIAKILGKIDDDRDGSIKVEDVLKVIEIIGQENVQLSSKQIDELIELMDKEEVLEAEDKIEKALNKSLEAKEKQKEQESKEKEKLLELQDKATDLALSEPQLKTESEKKLDESVLEGYTLQKDVERKDQTVSGTEKSSNAVPKSPPMSSTANIPPNIVPPPASSDLSKSAQDKRI